MQAAPLAYIGNGLTAMAPKRKGKATAAPAAAAEQPPAKKKKGGTQPGAGAPTNLQKAASSGRLQTIASMLDTHNPELLKVVNPKVRATAAQPQRQAAAARAWVQVARQVRQAFGHGGVQRAVAWRVRLPGSAAE